MILSIEPQSQRPLRGGKPLSEFINNLRSKEVASRAMVEGRKTLSSALGDGNPIRNLRLNAGLSQSELAARAGTTQSHIARVESGKVDPGTDMIAKIASALAVKPQAVFDAVYAFRFGVVNVD